MLYFVAIVRLVCKQILNFYIKFYGNENFLMSMLHK